jgi:hypothetical protein
MIKKSPDFLRNMDLSSWHAVFDSGIECVTEQETLEGTWGGVYSLFSFKATCPPIRDQSQRKDKR